MAELPVREMVLYKHGVGYFVRGGETDAAAVALTFREDEINDVLKSLTVIDRAAGGQVRGIHYPTPMDAAHRLANTSIKLSRNASLLDLLRDLRGRTVEARVERTPGTTETVSGRVIGVDYVNAERFSTHDPLESALLSLLTESGVEVLRLGDLRGVRIQEVQAARDLTYFLDTSTSQDARRTINVRLSEGTHDLMVSYVAPSPTWRVSYRVVAERDENDEAAGKMLLQGWGLFDNRLEEDLDDVRVTLVAGQPISFIYDLYESRIPKRPSVKDESRVAPGPVEYESAVEMESFDAFAAAAPSPEFARRAMPAAPMRRAAIMEDVAAAAPPAAESKATGEFFQYAVTTPVTVKRGESALVPIIGAEVSYERELLYNGAKLPKHPTAALRFENTTGLTLERGPVTLVEDGDYVGEAVVPFTKPVSEVYLPYAVELGITVTEKVDRAVELHRLNIKDRLLALEEYRVVTITYTLVSTLEDERTVVVEAIKDSGELHETRSPDAETASTHRWQVSVPGRGSVQFTRKTRELTQRVESIKNLEQPQLARFLRENLLSQATYDRLQELLDALASIRRMGERQNQLKARVEEIHEQQAQLRANMSALNPTGDEAAFRKRIVGQLEGKQDRLDEIHAERTRLQTAMVDAEKRVEAIIEGLST